MPWWHNLRLPNKEFFTLGELEASVEEENKEKNEDERDRELEETKEKVMEESSEEKLFILGRVLSKRKGVQGERVNPLPTHPLAQTLKQNFCHLIPEERRTGCDEPLLQTANSELIPFEEMVQSKIKQSLTPSIQINIRKEKKRVFKFRRDLFAWLILFQPEM